MTPLLVGIFALWLGPLVYTLTTLKAVQRAKQLVDVLVVLAIVGIVLFHILPHSWEIAGWLAVVGLVFGLAGPTIFEMLLVKLDHKAHVTLSWLVVSGIAIHEFIDGVALAVPDAHEHGVGALQFVVVLHRLPAGLILWWLVRPRYGLKIALGVLLGCTLATSLGFVLAGSFVHNLDSKNLALFEAFLAGFLLHVAVHRREGHKHGES